MQIGMFGEHCNDGEGFLGEYYLDNPSSPVVTPLAAFQACPAAAAL